MAKRSFCLYNDILVTAASSTFVFVVHVTCMHTRVSLKACQRLALSFASSIQQKLENRRWEKKMPTAVWLDCESALLKSVSSWARKEFSLVNPSILSQHFVRRKTDTPLQRRSDMYERVQTLDALPLLRFMWEITASFCLHRQMKTYQGVESDREIRISSPQQPSLTDHTSMHAAILNLQGSAPSF